MTKAEIVNEIAKSEKAKTAKIEKTQIEIVLNEFMNCVEDSLAKGNPVYLRGFGSFIVKHRAAKTAQNITAKTTVIVPEHDIPAFKPCDTFIDKVQGKE